ncbi:ABC transporter permease subunit [Streptomyces cocklensis]|jgi:putative aldouronate transport system permease protein|uniref:ABC transporter (Permease) for alpha-galacturonides n=1 Tax=Actinacidiphila cocklensis TaxID=887465 RepID=A0A9W4GUP1_9ACTN|nr:ABC transporter permease subunit [Actinacidiphila cocklensis]MDD1057669.1 ABC transporter permease subunit [Actinacidiphila cocklensis]WSX78821.1 ABC transporter permease subunit [Streptomyces sp. NBC_00899]CAG6398369.1 ABC transporter (permease) for alpha-galacturonides [Actinacidiphila cocklensis]
MSTTRTVDLPSEAAGAGGRTSARTRPRGRKRGNQGRRTWRQSLRRDWQLYSLAVLPLTFFAVFRYLPMAGNVIAFRRFHPGGSMFGDQWVGMRYFRLFWHDPTFWHVFTNTLVIGLLTLVFCFPMPIVLALLLNEVRSRKFKKLVQSISYLPHFLSTVIVAGVVMQFLSADGPVNQALHHFGHSPVLFIQQPGWFRSIYVSSELWQTVGWGTILYLAALTSIDDNLYEAARIDGANRWKQTWHVTLPGIRPTMVTLLILNIGTFMAVGFEKILLLYNPLTYPTADVVSTYLYRMGVVSNNFSYAAAIGLFESLIGLVLIVSANRISRRTVGTSLW